MATGSTTKHGWPSPLPADPATRVGADIRELAAAIDSTMPKITYGVGTPPTTGATEGDLHFQYV
jgi:hypothetical protein